MLPAVYITYISILITSLMTVWGYPRHQNNYHENHRTATMRYHDGIRYGAYSETSPLGPELPSSVQLRHIDSNVARIVYPADSPERDVLSMLQEDSRPSRRIHKRQDLTTPRPRWEHHPPETQPPKYRLTTTEGSIYETKPPRHTQYSSQDKTQGATDDELPDCEQVTQTQRRSASQDGDAIHQHTVRSSQGPCKPKQPESTTTSRKTPSWEKSQGPRPPTASPATTSSRDNTQKALGDIVFPDGTMFPSFTPARRSCNATFCTHSDDYPLAHINNLLQEKDLMYKGLFGRDEVEDPALRNRIDQADETPLCPSTEQVVFPREAQNKEDKWKWVVNQAPYLQGVRVETCIKEGPCQLSDSLPIGYKTFCKQKYIYRKMLGVNEEGQTASDSFKLPSCCSCVVKLDPVTRMHGLSPLPKNMSPVDKTLHKTKT